MLCIKYLTYISVYHNQTMVKHQISQIHLFDSYVLINLNCTYHIISCMKKTYKDIVLVLSCSNSVLGIAFQRPEKLKSYYLRGRM